MSKKLNPPSQKKHRGQILKADTVRHIEALLDDGAFLIAPVGDEEVWLRGLREFSI